MHCLKILFNYYFLILSFKSHTVTIWLHILLELGRHAWQYPIYMKKPPPYNEKQLTKICIYIDTTNSQKQ